MAMMHQREYSYGVIPVKKIGDDMSFLLVCHKRGHWDFPKGRPEEGEHDPVKIALRELEEEGCVSECKIMPDICFKDQYVCSYHGIEYNKTVKYFLGIVLAESTPHDDPDGDIVRRAWLSYEEAVQTLTYPRKKEILAEAKDYIDKCINDF
jgi:ADP-ribose pyrophosphatase YjhB (NUDIX family)